LLAIFAHPDDETYLAGGTLARYAASGCEVSVVCATFGEAGRRGEYAGLSREDFGALRRRELEAACAELGVRPPIFLGCADRALGRDCWDLATDEAVRIIRRLRPDVVLTFGPDGVSGHADHVALSQIVTAAFWGAGVPARSPHLAATPFQPAALYYVLRSAAVPSCCRPREGTSVPPVPTTTIAMGGFGERKLAAARCPRSQWHMQLLTREHTSAILTAPEVFHRAIPAWAGGGLETSFHGIGTALVEPRPHGPSVGLEDDAGSEHTEAST
jgi:LmbE family N-acetylglucosaminyl deacetylase